MEFPGVVYGKGPRRPGGRLLPSGRGPRGTNVSDTSVKNKFFRNLLIVAEAL